jgi:hypothetical protein
VAPEVAGLAADAVAGLAAAAVPDVALALDEAQVVLGRVANAAA